MRNEKFRKAIDFGTPHLNIECRKIYRGGGGPPLKPLPRKESVKSKEDDCAKLISMTVCFSNLARNQQRGLGICSTKINVDHHHIATGSHTSAF